MVDKFTFKAEISWVTLFFTSNTTPKAPTPNSEITLNNFLKGNSFPNIAISSKLLIRRCFDRMPSILSRTKVLAAEPEAVGVIIC